MDRTWKKNYFRIEMATELLIRIEVWNQIQLNENILWPSNVEHFKIILDNTNLFLLVCLVEVFQNYGYVHIDDDHVADDNKWGKIGDRQKGTTTVAIMAMFS